jgi:hypothetical protein
VCAGVEPALDHLQDSRVDEEDAHPPRRPVALGRRPAAVPDRGSGGRVAGGGVEAGCHPKSRRPTPPLAGAEPGWVRL